MTTTKLVALALATAASTGCIIQTEDDGYYDYGDGSATITARWEMHDLAGDRTTACPAGFLTAALVTQQVDELGRALANPVTDLFSCNDGFGITSGLVADRQLTWLEIRSDDGRNLYASSTSAIVDLYNTNATFDAQILNDGGYFQLDWNLVGEKSNKPLGCADVDSVETVATAAGETDAIVDKFTCEDRGGITAGLLAGPYTISIDAESNNKAIGTSPAITKSILDRNQITDLGAITIPITGL